MDQDVERAGQRSGGAVGGDASGAVTGEAQHVGAPTRFTSAGAVPPIAAGTHAAPQRTASDLAFHGPTSLDPSAPAKPMAPLPLAKEADLDARARRMQAEQLLKSATVTSGQEAIQALEVLLDVPAAERAKVIDQLDDKAFENLLDRVPESQRARFEPLVASATNPKRKLRMWAEAHKSRAHNDLRRYQGDFGDPEQVDGQSDKQRAAQARFDRRSTGVDATDFEVDNEVTTLLEKGDKLTVADVDAMRTRKDIELDVEMKHNVNLIAEADPRADGSTVEWSADESQQLDAALDNVPEQHAHGPSSVPTYARRANRHLMKTQGGQYAGNQIDVFDNSHQEPPGRVKAERAMVSREIRRDHGDQVGEVEYVATHEIGHDVASDHQTAFKKFEHTAGWTRQTKEQAREQGVDEKVHGTDMPAGVEDKVYTRKEDGQFLGVDRAAIPEASETKTGRWDYALQSPDEHFAELYAMAVQTPELLFEDYVARPAHETELALAEVAELRAQLAHLGMAHIKQYEAMLLRIKQAEDIVTNAKRLQQQRRDLFDIMRNDVFGTDQATRASVTRLRERKVPGAALREFEQAAARASTPAQIAELERQATR